MAYRTNQQSPYVKWLAIGAGGLLAYKFLKPLLTGGYSAITDEAITEAVKKQTGADRETIHACQDVADKIHAAVHGDYFDYNRDTKVATQMKLAHTAFQVRLICQLYLNKWSLSLKDDVESFSHIFTDYPQLFTSNYF